jgi:hypothetical protein
MKFNKFDIPRTESMQHTFDFMGLDEDQQREATAEVYKMAITASAHDIVDTVKRNPGKFLTAFIAGAITF